MSILTDVVEKALLEYVAAEIAKEKAPLKAEIEALTADNAALVAENAALTTENAALKAEVERLRNAPTPTTPTEPVPQEPKEPPVTPPSDLDYILYAPERIKAMPITGKTWDALVVMAKRTWSKPNLGDNNAQGDAEAVAGALYAIRMNDVAMRAKVEAQLRTAIASPLTRTLELSRGLPGYIIAANLIGFKETAFVDWVHRMVLHVFDKDDTHSGFQTVLATMLNLANNWANMARYAVVCAALYLQRVGTDAQKRDAAEWLKGGVEAQKRFIGMPSTGLPPLKLAPTGWNASATPMGVNPKESTIQVSGKTVYVSGVLHQDWLRGEINPTQWPPVYTGYRWEGMQNYVLTAVTLDRHGLLPFNSGDNAIVRSMDMLYGRGEAAKNTPVFVDKAAGDDQWLPHLVNQIARTDYPTTDDTMPGKSGVGWFAAYRIA